MLIDLTQDSDSDQGPANQPPVFFSSLAHHSVSSSIPRKRKSDRDSEVSSVSSFTPINGHVSLPKREPYTPSPATPAPATPGLVSVVIPSPSRQLKKEIDSADFISDTELTGLSEKYYPTDEHEKRAARGAYPSARKVRRADVPLSIGKPGPLLTNTDKRTVEEQLCGILRRKLTSIKGPSVTVAPGDEKLLAENTSAFEFINAYKLRKGVHPIDKEFNHGCNCVNFCNPAYCKCLSTEETSNDPIIPYERAKDNPRFLVLSPGFMGRTSMIYECNTLCGCQDSSCWNRVVEHGRTIRLEIFHTGNRGFGLRSPDFIRAGQFIDLYLGEVITKQAADVREEIASARNSASYLFSLDFLVNDENIYVVDGGNFGSPTRFINHSCNPNCRMFAVSRTHGDQYLYDLAFFAIKDIQPNTELTFDYNPRAEKTAKIDPNAVPCLCGEKNCRGQLWPNERKTTK